jgi:hypothetical protein
MSSSGCVGNNFCGYGWQVGYKIASGVMGGTYMSYICRTCGSTKSQAMADARTLGFERELKNGFYNCCQIAAWADEQWLTWLEAARQDGKPAVEITKPLECDHAEAVLTFIRHKHNRN